MKKPSAYSSDIIYDTNRFHFYKFCIVSALPYKYIYQQNAVSCNTFFDISLGNSLRYKKLR